MKNIQKFSQFLFAVMLITFLTSTVGFADIGKVIIAKGETFAIDLQNNSRQLKRRSEIHEGDTLFTGPNSEIQIRFNDNAVLALREGSQLKINEYHASTDAESEKVFMELLTGGFRTITGAFGKSDKDAYQIKTPNASIGIRGTNYEAVLSNNNLIVGVYKGGVKLTNSSGTLNLGLDSSFSYATVGSRKENIQGLMNPPGELTKPLATSSKAPPQVKDDSETEKTAQVQPEDQPLLIDNLFSGEEQQNTTAAANATIGTRLDTDRVSGVIRDEVTDAITNIDDTFDLSEFQDARLTQSQLRQLMENPQVGFVVVNNETNNYLLANYQMPLNASTLAALANEVSFDITLGSGQDAVTYNVVLPVASAGGMDLLIQGELDNLVGTINSAQVQSSITVSVVGGKLVFKGVTDLENSSITFSNFSGTGSEEVLVQQAMGLCDSGTITCSNGTYDLGAPSMGHVEHASHFGYILEGEYGPVFANYDSESIANLNGDYKSPDVVFKGNPNASIQNFTDVDVDLDGNDDVRWGIWNTSAANPALLLKSKDNLNSAEAVLAPFYFVSVSPALAAELIGIKTFNMTSDWHATSSVGTITDLTGSLSVDFASAEATGTLVAIIGPAGNLDSWELSYNGAIHGSQFISEFGIGTLQFNSQTFDAVGHVDGIFTGSGPNDIGIAGGFGMETTSGGHQAQGVFVMKE